MSAPSTIPCPACGAPVALPTAPAPDAKPLAAGSLGSFPFCGEACRLADLGKWADGTYRVSRPLSPDEQDAAEEEASRRPSGDDDE